jgi:predicted branched-subunit amino acid permease
MIGVVPFGMIYGALAIKAGIGPAAAQAMSSILFAGSAQFLTAQMTMNAVPGLVMLMALAVVNLRHMLYSASIAPFTRKLSRWWRVLLAYLLTDEAYVVAITEYEKKGITRNGHWYFLGAGAGLWTAWQASTAVGIVVGAAIPESWPLDFALPLSFIAMLVPLLKGRPSLMAAMVAGIAAVVLYPLPYKLSIILAAFAGIFTGVWMERRK